VENLIMGKRGKGLNSRFSVYRRKGRTFAFQTLFMMDMHQKFDEQAVLEGLNYFQPPLPEPVYQYAFSLLTSYLKHKHFVDQIVAQANSQWRIERMPNEDRNLLRLGITELAFSKDVPKRVVMDEWVEIAKQFGTKNFPPMLNAVLDRFAHEWRDTSPSG
jgi:N utilization substance protein B